MDDARRFLRYVIPGVLFATEALLLIMMLSPKAAASITSKVVAAESLAAALGALLGAGAIGIVLHFLHHGLLWTSPLRDVMAPDYTGVMSPCASESKEEAFIRMMAWWHGRKLNCKTIEGATPRADSLSDIMHGTGAAAYRSVLAPLVALFAIHLTPTDMKSPVSGWAAVFGGFTIVLLVWFHFGSYQHLRRQMVNFVKRVAEASCGDGEVPTPQQTSAVEVRTTKPRACLYFSILSLAFSVSALILAVLRTQ